LTELLKPTQVLLVVINIFSKQQTHKSKNNSGSKIGLNETIKNYTETCLKSIKTIKDNSVYRDMKYFVNKFDWLTLKKYSWHRPEVLNKTVCIDAEKQNTN
jgi:hypothetical protein